MNYISDNPTKRWLIQSPENYQDLKQSADVHFGDKVYCISAKSWSIVNNQGQLQPYEGD